MREVEPQPLDRLDRLTAATARLPRLLDRLEHHLATVLERPS